MEGAPLMIDQNQTEILDGLPPDSPRWRVHVEIEGEGPEMVEFRGFVDDRLLQLPQWRAAVVTAELRLIALTFSAFGSDHRSAMDDANGVLAQFGVPGGVSMSIELMSPEQRERKRKSRLPLLLGVKEVAQLSGYTRQRVSQLARDDGGPFPRPIAWVEATPLWLGDEIGEWQQEHRRART
jgi:predicted DNA-binding transcriptional regulator AlpA